jgi:5'-deoxynucleotidase YfbR-like HD superfamily hydrolase
VVGGPEMEKIIDFLMKIGKLKKMRRTGWVEAGIRDAESVAEHTFRTAVITMILADLYGLDAGKALKMAILHDLSEIETGDLTPRNKIKLGDGFAQIEISAIKKALSKLPSELRTNYFSLIMEYFSASSHEAKLVRQADKMEMILQAFEYEKSQSYSGELDRFWEANIFEGKFSEMAQILFERKKDVN